MKVKKGDLVKILNGKDRDKQGKVLRVDREAMKVVVEGVNVVKKHSKRRANAKDPGGIIEMEKPVHISKVMLLVDGKATRVNFKFDKSGNKSRYSHKLKKSV